ncbi:MAG: ABC transporter substrate-binding protein [Ignavibacteriae bacterium]|nr:ABC transporter substrate-binding protein [Ignavibacteriota bacterium]
MTEENKIVLVTPASSASDISRSGDFIFRRSASDGQAARLLAEKVSADGHKRVAVLYILNDYGKSYAESFSKYFSGTVALSESYETTETDFRTHLLKIKNANVTAVMMFINLEGSQLLRQFSESGLNQKIYGSTTWNSKPNLIGVLNESEGLIYPLTDVSVENSKYVDFEELFEEKYAKKPSIPWIAANSYDVFNIIYENMDYDLKKKLYEIEYNGASGIINFDENGDAFNDLRLVAIHNGTAQFI